MMAAFTGIGIQRSSATSWLPNGAIPIIRSFSFRSLAGRRPARHFRSISFAARRATLFPKVVPHLQQVAPHAEYTDIADATHMVVGDSNDAFSNAILGFLNCHHNPTGSGNERTANGA